ncbi:hypothetical protein Syun_027389 [Stephania yunnanensis]|uniref:Uncharacterized protein n=1 Tax=Stephania yunnanensis TaxID=152371 RepID=A0AAP0EL01_9MAGN
MRENRDGCVHRMSCGGNLRVTSGNQMNKRDCASNEEVRMESLQESELVQRARKGKMMVEGEPFARSIAQLDNWGVFGKKRSHVDMACPMCEVSPMGMDSRSPLIGPAGEVAHEDTNSSDSALTGTKNWGSLHWEVGTHRITKRDATEECHISRDFELPSHRERLTAGFTVTSTPRVMGLRPGTIQPSPLTRNSLRVISLQAEFEAEGEVEIESIHLDDNIEREASVAYREEAIVDR